MDIILVKKHICFLIPLKSMKKSEENKVNVIIIEYVWICLNVPK